MPPTSSRLRRYLALGTGAMIIGVAGAVAASAGGSTNAVTDDPFGLYCEISIQAQGSGDDFARMFGDGESAQVRLSIDAARRQWWSSSLQTDTPEFMHTIQWPYFDGQMKRLSSSSGDRVVLWEGMRSESGAVTQTLSEMTIDLRDGAYRWEHELSGPQGSGAIVWSGLCRPADFVPPPQSE